MGLDISVYSNVSFMTKGEELTDSVRDTYHDKYIFIHVNKHFKKQADGLVTGFYKGNRNFGFRAGSYGGYSHFREWLSETFLEVDPKIIWDNPNTFIGKPFVELINFSDCEGVIGAKTSTKLFEDFAKYASKKDAFGKTYYNFMKAFEIASSEVGIVQFH